MESRSSKRLLRKTTKAPERLVDIKASSEAKETFEPKPDAKTKKDNSTTLRFSKSRTKW